MLADLCSSGVPLYACVNWDIQYMYMYIREWISGVLCYRDSLLHKSSGVRSNFLQLLL